jgi:hypothetical protein
MEKTSWLERLSLEFELAGGEQLRDEILQGSQNLSSGSAPGTKARWVSAMLARMEQRLDGETQARVMAACHCGYPQPGIRRMKAVFDATHAIGPVIEALREERREHLWGRLGKDPGLWEKVQAEPYFTSPIREGRTVVHISAPYHPWVTLVEQDEQKKRAHYCHCGWINGSKTNVQPVFCNCGAGYYQALWEGVLGRPVQAAVLSTVFQGADACRIRVTLPEDCLE